MHKATVSRELRRSFSAPGSRSPKAATVRGGGEGYLWVYDATRAQCFAEHKAPGPEDLRLDHGPLREQVWQWLRAELTARLRSSEPKRKAQTGGAKRVTLGITGWSVRPA